MPNLSSTWSFVFLSLNLLKIIPNTTSDYVSSKCSKQTTFAPSSIYATNLYTLFHYLSSNATISNPSGFYSTTIGNGSNDVVYGLFLCRGDQNTTQCHECVASATTVDLPKTYCPNRKVAIIWYDECMVRYSNQPFLGQMNDSPNVILMNTPNINGNQTQIEDLVGNMMNDLTTRASVNDSLGRKFATTSVYFTNFYSLYGMAQCTPDLAQDDCKRCFLIANGKLIIKQGSRVLQPSCMIRYETYPFYDGADTLVPPLSSPPTNSNGHSSAGKNKVSAKVIISMVVPVTILSTIILSIGVFFIRKRPKRSDVLATESGVIVEDLSDPESLQYDLPTLQHATNNFSDYNKLGEGGFGNVYKGTLPNGQEIAVKRLSRSSGQGLREFKNEVLLVSKLQHRNLVRLLGFCFTRKEKILVYEYFPNKSLDNFLFDSEQRNKLDWRKRYKILCGISRGMLYLHQGSQQTIVHRDLKPSNILLDVNMNPKISDFGMARIFGLDQTHADTSKIVGTYGYMAPEYAIEGKFSIKSDVYSFGVLAFEIISGKRNSTFYESGYAEDLLSYAWKKWTDGYPLEFVDPTIRDACPSNEVMRCMNLAFLCVEESLQNRPTMEKVVLVLDSHTVSLPLPKQPAAFFGKKSRA